MAQPSPLGMGLGLRPVYYPDILEKNPRVDWFEVISENFMVPGGRPIAMLERIRTSYPIVMHGVSMSIASTAPLDLTYLGALKSLADRFQPEWISDHLCWTGVHGINLHDLLPIPYTVEALDHVVDRIMRVQDFLGRRMAIENVSTYVTFAESEMDECTFVREVTERADCWLLLDVNNVFVSSPIVDSYRNSGRVRLRNHSLWRLPCKPQLTTPKHRPLSVMILARFSSRWN